MARAFDHPFCLLAGRHFGVRSMRSTRLHRLFQVHQTIIRFPFFVVHLQEDGVAGTTERTAPFHPISGVDELYFRVIVSRAQSSREAVHVFLAEKWLIAVLCGWDAQPVGFVVWRIGESRSSEGCETLRRRPKTIASCLGSAVKS